MLTLSAPASTFAGIVTAIGVVGGAIIALCGAVTAIVLLIRTKSAVDSTATTTAEIHVLVNQRFTDMERYLATVLETLRAAGIPIPVDQSKPIIPPQEVPDG